MHAEPPSAIALQGLSAHQADLLRAIAAGFQTEIHAQRDRASDLISEHALRTIADHLLLHRTIYSDKNPIKGEAFEFLLTKAVSDPDHQIDYADSRTNPAWDLRLGDVRLSLKTEASKTIKDHIIHISKWMELGKGEWNLEDLLQQFITNINMCDRFLILRFFGNKTNNPKSKYELVEIPKEVLLGAQKCKPETIESSNQTPKPGRGIVYDHDGNEAFHLYFDGGTERKLQLKNLRKDLCRIHAVWQIGAPQDDGPVARRTAAWT